MPTIKPYRQAVATAAAADAFADIVPPEDVDIITASREYAKKLRAYAGPSDPIDPPKKP